MARNNLIKFIPFFVFIILAGIFLYSLIKEETPISSPLLNKKVPVFNLPNLYDKNKTVSNEDFDGQIYAINFFASWCEGCNIEHENIGKISKKIPVLGIAVNDKERALKSWLKEKGNYYEVIAVDVKGRSSIDFGVYGLPETYIINKQNVIIYKHTGAISNDDFKKKILPLINKYRGK